MSDFERQLMGEIPLHEASDFFTSMKQPSASGEQTKVAGAASDMMDQLVRGEMPAGKAGKFKPVDQIKTSASLAEVEGMTSKRMKSLYRDTGIAQGGVKGGLAGAALGAAGGAIRGGLQGGKAQALKGALLGGRAGGAIGAVAGGATGGVKGSKRGAGVGDHINTMRRESLSKSLAINNVQRALLAQAQKDPAFHRGLVEASGGQMRKAAMILKRAFGEEAMGAGGAAMGGGANQQGPAPAAQESAPGVDPGSAAPAPAPVAPVQDLQAAMPTTAPTVAVNYQAAELAARAAQDANEVGFLRDRLNAATEQNQAAQQQLQEAQQQVAQMQQDTAMSGEQIMSATNEAVAASDRALQQSMQAANMRMGIQKMREAMLQLASQDPETMGTMAQQEQQQAEQMQAQAGQQAVNGQAGAPGQVGAPEAAPGAVAAEGGPETGGAPSEAGAGAPGKSTAPSINIKTGSMGAALPGAAIGAGLAALQGYRRSANGVEESQREVAELEQQQQSGSFGKALDLMKAKQRLANNELAQSHPIASNVRNVVGGAIGGAALGTAGKQLWNTARKVL